MTTVVSHGEWAAAREALLAEEKALTRARDEVARKRRELPWERVDQDYTFAGEAGPVTLAQLFGGRSQLVVSHFMFGPDWQEGCPSCSFWADSYEGNLAHLAARDIAFVAVSRAPLERLLAYRARMGWTFPWVSSLGNEFNTDYHVTVDGNELPGLSVFALGHDGAVYHTYSTYQRGLDPMNSAYQLMDLVPKGRDEGGLPWSMAWLRRHDRY